jgi:hypothetical protein
MKATAFFFARRTVAFTGARQRVPCDAVFGAVIS